MTTHTSMETVERWTAFEIALRGPRGGNPFVDVALSARFQHHNRVLEPEGFYDGDGVYRIRFMPDEPGEWRYVTRSNAAELDGQAGAFECVEAGPGNHGPVRVRDGFHFGHEDGTPYIPVGTTCYAWAHQGDALEAQTLATLAASPFNKLRMCLFPKHYAYNANEPVYHPFEPAAGGGWDFARFNPAFFQHFERRVGDLLALGIQADVILFHPYDRWGYAGMGAEADDRTLRYVAARLAAYRNVWWSLANEYDIMEGKRLEDWDRFFKILLARDPAQHLRSIHNCHGFYNHALPWVTHASIQHAAVERVAEWRAAYGKPVVIDECGYEGDIPEGWGNFTPQEHLRRFWIGFVTGGYVGHGETYRHPQDLLWWSKGGQLRGQTPARIAFLRRILEAAPAGLTPNSRWDLWSGRCGDDLLLFYLDSHQPWRFVTTLPEGRDYAVDVIDTWDMTITPREGTFRGRIEIDLPVKPGLAIRATAKPG
jgi:hypothetical protein